MSKFLQKLGIWTCAKRIGDIIDYVKEHIQEAKELKGTVNIIEYIFDLIKDIILFYREIQQTDAPATKGGKAEMVQYEYKTDFLQQVAKKVRSARND